MTNTVTINGIEYTPVPTFSDRPLRIVVLQRGWVVVGRWTEQNDRCTLAEGSVIRRWGTTGGLSQLAAKGPQAATVLEPVTSGLIRFHILTMVQSFDCDETAW